MTTVPRPAFAAWKGGTFMNEFATIEVVAPDWHMEPLFTMPRDERTPQE